MNYVVVYEIINDSSNPYLIVPFFITMFVFTLLLISFIKGRKKKITPGQIVGLAFFVLMAALSIYNVFKIKQYQKIIDDYENGEYLIVEGVIEDFVAISSENQQETFKVNEVKFAVPNNIGYSLTALTDSYIYQNGQKVKIGYMVIDDINYIVRIEIYEGNQ